MVSDGAAGQLHLDFLVPEQPLRHLISGPPVELEQPGRKFACSVPNAIPLEWAAYAVDFGEGIKQILQNSNVRNSRLWSKECMG